MLDYRITVEKVLTWGQAQAKPFHNQWGNQTGPRRGRNKWAQSGGGESGSPGKQRQGGGRVALLAAELGPGQQRSQAGSFGPRYLQRYRSKGNVCSGQVWGFACILLFGIRV